MILQKQKLKKRRISFFFENNDIDESDEINEFFFLKV